MAVDTEQLR